MYRFRELRQPDFRAGRHPGDERLPDRDEATQGPAEEAQGRQQALLGKAKRGGGGRKVAAETRHTKNGSWKPNKKPGVWHLHEFTLSSNCTC